MYGMYSDDSNMARALDSTSEEQERGGGEESEINTTRASTDYNVLLTSFHFVLVGDSV